MAQANKTVLTGVAACHLCAPKASGWVSSLGWEDPLEEGMEWTLKGSFPLGLTGLISLLSKGLWRVFSSITVQKHQFFGAQLTSMVLQTVKRLSTMRETQVWSLGWEDPLEREIAIHSSTIAWKIPWTEEPGRLQSMGSQRVGHDWATSLFSCLYGPSLTYIHDYWKNHIFDYMGLCWQSNVSAFQ